MGSATGLTAAKMLELANQAPTGGLVDSNGHLIFNTYGGDSLDFGKITNDLAQVITLPSGLAAPSGYPIGTSVGSVSAGSAAAATTAGWPADLLTVVTDRKSAARTTQTATQKATGKQWIRSEANADDWTVWRLTLAAGDAVTDDMLPARSYTGVVSPTYTTGLVPVTVTGVGTVNASSLRNQPARAGSTVLIEKIGTTWIVVDEVVTTPDYNQFIPFNLQAAWKIYNPPSPDYGIPSYTKTAQGWVVLKGMVTGGVGNTIIGNLPVGMRPLYGAIHFPTFTSAGVGSIRVDVNGDVVAGNIPGNPYVTLDHVRFYVGTISNLLTFGAYQNGFANFGGTWPVGQIGKDAEGFTFIRGLLLASSTAADNMAIHGITAATYGETSRKQMHIPVASNNIAGGLGPNLLNDALLFKLPSQSSVWLSLDGAMWDSNATNRYTAPIWANGWMDYDANNYSPAGYQKRSDGLVSLRGLIKSGTMGVSAFQLPPGFRPKSKILRYAMNGTSADRVGRLDITTDGQVIPVNGGNAWFSLDGVTFIAEQ